jgi:hypothetical protein
MSIKEKVVLCTTPGGKTIEFVRKGRIGVIQFSTGGQLPPELLGGWTDQKNAKIAADNYLAKLQYEDKKGK